MVEQISRPTCSAHQINAEAATELARLGYLRVAGASAFPALIEQDQGCRVHESSVTTSVTRDDARPIRTVPCETRVSRVTIRAFPQPILIVKVPPCLSLNMLMKSS